MDMIRTGYLWKLKDGKKVSFRFLLGGRVVSKYFFNLLRIGINYGFH